MTDANFALSVDSDLDDLPRTIRREKEARARQRETGTAGIPAYQARTDSYFSTPPIADEPVPAAVTRIDMPFVRLVTFFLKAVVAAVPALLLLGAILWAAGEILQVFFPQLIKMKILISFPSG